MRTVEGVWGNKQSIFPHFSRGELTRGRRARHASKALRAGKPFRGTQPLTRGWGRENPTRVTVASNATKSDKARNYRALSFKKISGPDDTR